MEPYTLSELMVVAAAREIRDRRAEEKVLPAMFDDPGAIPGGPATARRQHPAGRPELVRDDNPLRPVQMKGGGRMALQAL